MGLLCDCLALDGQRSCTFKNRPCCRLRQRLGTDIPVPLPPVFMRLIALEEKSPNKSKASGVLGHPISAGDMCLIAHAYAAALEPANVIRALCFCGTLA